MFNRFAAGKKVYGSGAPAPTRGVNNPSGYIKREISRQNNPYGVSRQGNDGQSDTRSGLAHHAVQAQQDIHRVGLGQAHAVGPGGMKQGGNSIRRGSGNGPMKPGGNNPQGPGGAGQSQANYVRTQGTPGAVGAPPAQAVQVSPNGQLNLPYNSDFYNQAVDAQQNFDSDMMNIQMEDQQEGLDIQRTQRDAGASYLQQQGSSLNGAAGSGNAFSSAYGNAVNDDSRNYQNFMNDLTVDHTNFQANQGNRRNAASQALNTMLQRATQGYSQSLLDNAGALGFGQNAVAPIAPAQAAAQAGAGRNRGLANNATAAAWLAAGAHNNGNNGNNGNNNNNKGKGKKR